MSANKITSLSSALISPLWVCLSIIVVFVACSVSSQEPINNQGQVQQQQQQLWVEPPMNLVPVPGPAPENNVQPLISLPYQYQTRQFYYPQQQGLQGGFYQPYGQQYQQQQYPNNYGQFQYPQYFNQGQNGFGNPSQGFYRPPSTTTTAAATTTTAAGATTTTTTTTPRPLQVGVSTLFPLVGAGSGFGRPGSNNVLNGQTAAFGAGLPFQYYQQG